MSKPIKRRLGGHKTPTERFFDLASQTAVAFGVKNFSDIDKIKTTEYSMKDKREQNHGTSIRKMGSDSFKSSQSFSMWGEKLIPEGIDNISGRVLLERLFDGAVDNPISYNSSYKKNEDNDKESDIE
jgi:hypothetical protein